MNEPITTADLLAYIKQLEQLKTTQTPQRGRSSKSEPVHLKFGPEAHFGESKRGPHYGLDTDLGKVHIYPKKIYIGNARKGYGRPLTADEMLAARGLFGAEQKKVGMLKHAYEVGVAGALKDFLGAEKLAGLPHWAQASLLGALTTGGLAAAMGGTNHLLGREDKYNSSLLARVGISAGMGAALGPLALRVFGKGRPPTPLGQRTQDILEGLGDLSTIAL